MIVDWREVDLESGGDEVSDWVEVKPKRAIGPVDDWVEVTDWKEVEPTKPSYLKPKAAPTQSTTGAFTPQQSVAPSFVTDLAKGVGLGAVRPFMDPLAKAGKVLQRNPWITNPTTLFDKEAAQNVSDMYGSVYDYYGGKDIQAQMAPETPAEEAGQVVGGILGAVPKYANPAGVGLATGEAVLGGAYQYETAREQGASPLRAAPAAAIKTLTDVVVNRMMLRMGGQTASTLATPGLNPKEIATTILKDLGVNLGAAEAQLIVDNATAIVGGADPNRGLFQGAATIAPQALAMPLAGYATGRTAGANRLMEAARRAEALRNMQSPPPIDATRTGAVSYAAPLSRKAGRYAYVYEQPENTAVVPIDTTPTPPPAPSEVARPELVGFWQAAKTNIEADPIAAANAEYAARNANVAWKVQQLEAELSKKGKLSKPKMKRLTELRNSMSEDRLGLVNREQFAQEEAVRRLNDTDLSDWLGYTPRAEGNEPFLIASDLGRTPNFEATFGLPSTRTAPMPSGRKVKQPVDATLPPPRPASERPEIPTEGVKVNKLWNFLISQERKADIDPQFEAARRPMRSYIRRAEQHEVSHGRVREAAEGLSDTELDQVGELLSFARRRGKRITPEEAERAGFTKRARKAAEDFTDDYRAQMEEMIGAAKQRAADTGKADYAKEAEYYQRLLEANPEYAPFGRMGKYSVRATDAEGKTLAYMEADNTIKLKADIARLKKEDPSLDGAKWEDIRLTAPKLKKGEVKAVDTQALAEAARILKEDHGIELGVDSPVLADLYRTILMEKQSRGFAGRMLRASLTPGESRDFVRQHYDYTKQVGRRVAELAHGLDVDENISRLDQMAGTVPADKQAAVLQNLQKLQSERDYLRQGGAGRGVRRASAATTVYAMGGDLAQLVVQPVQKITHSAPSFAVEFGIARGARAQLRGNAIATKIMARNALRPGERDVTLDAGDVRGFTPKGMTDDDFAAEFTSVLKEQHEAGELMDIPRSTFMSSVPEPAATDVGGMLQKGVTWMLKPLQVGEYHNRTADFVGAYAEMRRRGMDIPEAKREAARLMERANNVGGDANTNELMRRFPNLGPIAYKFKSFPQQYVELMHRNATKAFKDAVGRGESKAVAAVKGALPVVGPMTVVGMLAGYKAIPLANDAWEAVRGVSNLFVKPDEEELMKSLPQTVDEWMRKEEIPEELRDAVMMGVGSFYGIDLSGRLGLDRVIGLDTEKTAMENVGGMALGANKMLAERGEKVGEAIQRGSAGDLATSLAPRGLANLGAALSGEQRIAGGEVKEMTAGERILKGVGLQSTRMSKASGEQRALKSYEKTRTIKAKAFAGELDRALEREDWEESVRTITDKILKYNNNLGENSPGAINPRTAIRSALRRRLKSHGLTPNKNLAKLRLYLNNLEADGGEDD